MALINYLRFQGFFYFYCYSVFFRWGLIELWFRFTYARDRTLYHCCIILLWIFLDTPCMAYYPSHCQPLPFSCFVNLFQSCTKCQLIIWLTTGRGICIFYGWKSSKSTQYAVSSLHYYYSNICYFLHQHYILNMYTLYIQIQILLFWSTVDHSANLAMSDLTAENIRLIWTKKLHIIMKIRNSVSKRIWKHKTCLDQIM